MKLGKYLILKDKQFYRNDMKLLGGVGIIKNLKEYDLLHIRDLDLDKGSLKNYDIYDRLTYDIHVQVEVYKEIDILEELLNINVRLVGFPNIMKKPIYKAIMINNIEELRNEIKDVIVKDRQLFEKLVGSKYRLMTFGFIDERAFLCIDVNI